MKFRYTAKNKQGEMQIGFIEAENRETAADILYSHDLFVLSVTPTEVTHWYDRIGNYFRGVKNKDMVVFTRQLSTLLEARIPLNDALKTLAKQISHPILKQTVSMMSEDIDAGLSFSQALGRQSTVFSDFFVSMIRSAEVTGNIDDVANFLADYYEKEYALVSKARSALIYPAVIILLFVAVAAVMIIFILPQLKPVFEEAQIDLPVYTKILLGSGDFFAKWWWAIGLGIAALVTIILNYLKTPEGRALWDEMKLRLPVINKVYVPLSIARFSNAASILLKGGVPVSQAMEIVSHTVDNTLYQDLLHEAAESVRQGEPLSQTMERHPDYVPPLVPQMLVVGETTGQLDKIFARIATFYTRDADKSITNMVDLIQPLLMIGIGLMVGGLFAAILLPIFQLTQSAL